MIHPSYQLWLDNNKPQIYCECNCGGEIVIKSWYKQRGIPKFLHGHNSKFKKNSTVFQKGSISWNKGKECPQISESLKGKPLSEKHKQKISTFQKGKHLSEETKEKISESNKGKHSGDKSGWWKGGVTLLKGLIRSSLKYSEWRLLVYQRDGFRCQACEKIGGKLNAHHIKRFSEIMKDNNIKTLEEAYMCDELWDLNNGITLCKECHNKINRND